MFDVEFIRETARNYPGIIQRVEDKFLAEAGIIVQATAKRLAPVDQGNLKGSINRERVGHTEEVGTNVDYAEAVEFGAQPHMPPVQPLIEWAGRVLGNPDAGWAVAKGIAKKGTKKQPFMRPAIDENRRGLLRKLAALLRQEIARGRN